MQAPFINKMAILIAVVTLLLVTVNAQAQEDKVAIVDQIMQQSSIKITVQGIPQQLAQMPQMLPISAKDQAAFVDEFTAELASSFNEADALRSMRDYFVENGDTAKLLEIQQWLTSPVGQRVTQVELLSQQQIDIAKLQKFMQRYRPEKQNERHQQYIRLVSALALSDKIFTLLETLAPKVFDIFAQNSPDAKELQKSVTGNAADAFQKKLGGMKKSFNAAVGPQMVTAMAFQLQDLSDEELSAYANFMETDAGKHFNDLALRSSIDYSTEWVLNILPNLIQNLEAIKK
jgi:hypothetical protein